MSAQADHAAHPTQALSAPRARPPRRSSVPIHHARGHMYGTLARTTRPRPATLVSAWSDRYRVLTSKSSGEAGPWRTDRVPFAREIMDCLSTHHPAQRIVLKFATQMTKALDLDTPIPTAAGWTRMGDVVVGDRLFDERGEPCTVLAVSEINVGRPCYRVRFSDGSEIVADAGHRWFVESVTPLTPGRPHHGGARSGVLTTEEIAATVRCGTNRNRYAVPVAEPLQCRETDLPIAPYTLGVWLGDGHAYSAQATLHVDDAPALCARIRAEGYVVDDAGLRGKALTVRLDPCGTREGQCLRGHRLAETGHYTVIRRGRPVEICAECQRQHSMKAQFGRAVDPVVRPSFHKRLADAGLLRNKHIPAAYLRASAAQRMALLQGLMDTDGGIDPRSHRCRITSSTPALAAGIVELIRSLGYKPTTKMTYPKQGRPSLSIGFTAYAERPVFHLPRKRAHLRTQAGQRASEALRRRIVAVDPVPTRPVRCLAVDSPSHLFLAGEGMIPTHNTELALNWLGYIIDHAPAPTLVVLPTLEVRKRWVRQRLDPLLNETPQIRRIFDGRRKRDAGNSEDLKDYPGGMLVISGANSPASLASMPIKYVVCDEVDRFPWEAGEEGDPLGLIDERTKTFPRRKVLLVSTPTTAGISRIDDEYQASDRREYEVPCPHCGHHQVLYWTRPDGEPGLIRNAATGAVYYRCANSACGERIDERHKPGMLAAGRWLPRDPGKPTRGYHINALYAPIGLGFSWAELWDKWEDARGDTAKLKRFVNTSLGEVWVEQGESLDTLSLIGRLEDYGEFPARLRTAGVDVQKDRLEVTLVDWTAGEEAWTRDHLILPGDTALPEVWDELEEVLREARVNFAGIDSGYNTSMVYDFCEAAGVWCYALKGMDGPGRPIVEDERRIRQRYRARRKRAAPIYVVGVDQAKALLYARMKLRQVGPGYVHFPRTPAFDDEYFAQLGAEKLVTKVHGNRAFAEWVKTRSRNEALDCYVYALAALRLSGKDPADYADKTRAELRADRSDAAAAGEDAADSIFAPISMT